MRELGEEREREARRMAELENQKREGQVMMYPRVLLVSESVRVKERMTFRDNIYPKKFFCV